MPRIKSSRDRWIDTFLKRLRELLKEKLPDTRDKHELARAAYHISCVELRHVLYRSEGKRVVENKGGV